MWVVPEFRKISICTTCMRRLYDLKETLPKNIEFNQDYPNVEFVLLDYNSDDGLDEWVKKEMMQHIESGLLVYYKTIEPKFYNMSHSRNVAFKLATGDIVNNVDADNQTNIGFAAKINEMSKPYRSGAIFAKSNRLMRGRLGFFKNDFIEILGGYDEGMVGYGHDDRDLFLRALRMSFKFLWFGGFYVIRKGTPFKEKQANMEIKNWKYTERLNIKRSEENLKASKFKANEGVHWGKATVTKNFKEIIII